MKLPEGFKRVVCKWVFKTNVTLMTILNVKRLDLLPKVLLKRMNLIIRKHFFPISKKDFFRIIMELIVHYDLVASDGC